LRACDAIQLVMQEESGLPRRFAPRNDGVETRSFAMTADRHCERERSNPVGGWRGVAGLGREMAGISWIASRSFAMTVGAHVRSR
jgi:hypothetical protein